MNFSTQAYLHQNVWEVQLLIFSIGNWYDLVLLEYHQASLIHLRRRKFQACHIVESKYTARVQDQKWSGNQYSLVGISEGEYPNNTCP